MAMTLDAPRRCISIGVAATMLGIAPQTIRDMEAKGLIPRAARVEGLGRRLYSLEDVEAIRRVREVLQHQRETSAA